MATQRTTKHLVRCHVSTGTPGCAGRRNAGADWIVVGVMAVSRRLDEATLAIDERMKMPIEPDDLEHQTIQEARSGIAMLKAVASNARPV
jgi:hypothetical protein